MMRISDLASALFRDYTINRRKSLRTVKGRWLRHLKPFFQKIPAEKLTVDQVEKYIAFRLEQKAEPSTINRELAILKRLYTLAIRSRKLSLAECPYVPHLPENNVRKGFLRDFQFDALVSETAKIGLWLRGMLEVAATYGCRKSELTNLKVRQVIFDDKTIVLDAGETKNGEARILPMTSKVLELLTQCVAGKDAEAFVFTRSLDRRGRKTRTARIVDFRKDWERACTAAGVPDLLFHDLRRSAIRALIRCGVSQPVAMMISGHRTASVFQRYNITDVSDLRDAVSKVEHAGIVRRQPETFEQPTAIPEKIQ